MGYALGAPKASRPIPNTATFPAVDTETAYGGKVKSR